MATSENLVKRKLDSWLEANLPGNWKVKPRGGMFGKAGCPDVLICWRGLFIAIEVKSDTGEPSVLQMMNLRMIQRAGGVAVLLRGYDLAKLEAMKLAIQTKLDFHDREDETQL